MHYHVYSVRVLYMHVHVDVNLDMYEYVQHLVQWLANRYFLWIQKKVWILTFT